MKILQLITSLRVGGAEMLAVQMADMLRLRGHEVGIAVLDGERTSLSEQAKSKGIPVIRLGGSAYNPLAILKIARLMKGYDVVHAHNASPQFFAAIASLFAGKGAKLATTEHNTTNRRRGSRLWRLADRWMYGRYSMIACIAEPARDNLSRHLGRYEDRMTVIHNGIDLEAFRDPAPCPDARRDNCKCNIIMVAGFREQKDQDTLIRAVALLPESRFHLWLVGDGSRRPQLEALIKSERAEDRCTLLGLRSDVPSLLRTADITVMSSHYEGLSLSSVEGMAAGKPMIASDVPGLKEVVGGAGILFPEGDSQELARILAKLADDRSFYDAIAAQCLERARQYDIRKMIDRYENLYHQVTEQ